MPPGPGEAAGRAGRAEGGSPVALARLSLRGGTSNPPPPPEAPAPLNLLCARLRRRERVVVWGWFFLFFCAGFVLLLRLAGKSAEV